MPDMNDGIGPVGSWLVKHMNALGISNWDMAFSTNKSPGWVRDIKEGRFEPHPDEFRAMEKAILSKIGQRYLESVIVGGEG